MPASTLILGQFHWIELYCNCINLQFLHPFVVAYWVITRQIILICVILNALVIVVIFLEIFFYCVWDLTKYVRKA